MKSADWLCSFGYRVLPWSDLTLHVKLDHDSDNYDNGFYYLLILLIHSLHVLLSYFLMRMRMRLLSAYLILLNFVFSFSNVLMNID